MAVRIKVLEISGYPPPHGGWSVRTEQVKKKMDAEGHDCVVLNTGESRRIPSPHYETVENGRVYIRKVWRYARQGYLVHTHANGETPKGILLAIIAEVLAAVAGIGSVLTLHAGTNQVYFPRNKSRLWVPVFRLLFRLPKAIICNSEEVKNCIVGYGVPADKIVPIPAFSAQYLDIDTVPLADSIERHFARYPRSLFCYIAMRPVYYPHVLLAGFASLIKTHPDLGMVVCGLTGHGDNAVESAFSKMIDDLGLRDRLCIVGNLSHDEFLTAMTRSVAYVRTHVSDGVCSSILEALTLGVPVVACENGTRPSGVVTFPPESPEVLVEALCSVLRSASATVATEAKATTKVDIPDTVRLEIDLLADTFRPRQRPEAVVA